MMTQPFLLEKIEVKFNKTELKGVNLPRKYYSVCLTMECSSKETYKVSILNSS